MFFWWFTNRQLQFYSQKCTCNKFYFSSWCSESIYILQENPLKYFFQDPKNLLAVCSLSMAHSAHNSLSAWTDDFIFSVSVHLQNGVANSEMCICALLSFALQVKGLFSGYYQKKNKKTKNIKNVKKVLEKSSHSGILNDLAIN